MRSQGWDATDIGRPVAAMEIDVFIARLAAESPACLDDERVDRLRALESLKAAAAAAQAREMVTFADSQIDAQAAQGVRPADLGRGVPSQIGLACRQSPFRAARMLGTARSLLTDLPETFAALSRGETTEFRATLVARETACLKPEDRRRVDAELGPRLHELGDRATEAEARRWVCRLDNAAAARRAAKAEGDRCVTIRPAPDTMTYLTGLLPVKDGVSVYAALDAAATAATTRGDTRSRGQIMADTLVDRVTGRAAAGTFPRVEIGLVMTDRALLGGEDEPAMVTGYGPVPADVARRWVLWLLRERADESSSEGMPERESVGESEGLVWLRRLFTSPDGRRLVGMDSRRRLFSGKLRRLIEFRDQRCTTPFCGAPIRQIDHIEPARRDGRTSYANGRACCARCNQAKEAPGWSAHVADPATVLGEAGERTVTLTTPTGHRYTSRPPPVPGSRVREDRPPRTRGEPREPRAG